ncbi:glycosyl transferase [Blastocystis sp. subtype 4]|uniref:glycosyl transferase n=1 Tax=Blastocystis sp. subtype 4 TaxID=944170 RepID=UPI0007118AF6|nr:glycosyl transferase [Blastocystis sp. subtype 4]KNB43957.1 glycosyl transferase [Blastocystis sp. subtype 4]|eukprot:XP_014527400.1 glycosyl transferase [Blastocystis sp. subtype 4]
MYINTLYRVKVGPMIEDDNGLKVLQDKVRGTGPWKFFGGFMLFDKSVQTQHLRGQSSRVLLTLCSTFLVHKRTPYLEYFFKTYSLFQRLFDVRVLVFSDCEVIQQLGQEYNITIIPNVPLNEFSKPIFPEMMRRVEKEVDSVFYGYVNGDIILSSNVVTILRELSTNLRSSFIINSGVMLAGRVKEVEHANLTFTSLDAFLSSFNRSYAEGLMRNPLSADYFIYSGRMMSKKDMDYEPVVLGRFYIDNWIMGSIALNNGYLIDTTEVVEGIHLGTDTYWKKSIKQLQNPRDFLYNKLIVRREYPWSSLMEANYSARWHGNYLYLEKNF